MSKTIVFPVNSKGGVGKTSIIGDLATITAQHYDVGLIDTDIQATLVSPLMGKSMVHAVFKSPAQSRAVSVMLLEDQGFYAVRHNSAYGVAVDIPPVYAHAAFLPLGNIRDAASQQQTLDSVLQAMDKDDFIFVDIPPVVHPEMVLDSTILPVLRRSNDVHVVPLLVSTPEHNVIDLTLACYSRVQSHLEARGVNKENISPLFVLNKVPYVYEESDPENEVERLAAGLLVERGLLKGQPLPRSHRHHDYFSFESFFPTIRAGEKAYPLIAVPTVDQFVQGQYTLFFVGVTELWHYPFIADEVEHFRVDVQDGQDPRYYVLSQSLHRLAKTLFEKASLPYPPPKNYTVEPHGHDELLEDSAEHSP